MSEIKCLNPNLRLEVSNCGALGINDITFTFYNDFEVMRRKVQIYACLVLNDTLNTNDITVLIVKYMRDLCNLDEMTSCLSRIFDISSKIIFNTMRIQMLSSMTLREKSKPNLLFSHRALMFEGTDSEMPPFMKAIKAQFFAILNNEVTTITYRHQTHSSEVSGLMIHIVSSLLITFPSLWIRVESHQKQAFFDTCLSILEKYLGVSGHHRLISKTPFTSLGLGDDVSLSVVDCVYCVEPEISSSPFSCILQ